MLPVAAGFLASGSVGVFAWVAVQVLLGAVANYRSRYLLKSVEDLGDLFVFVDLGQLWILSGCGIGLMAVVGALLLGPWGACALGLLGALAPGSLVWMLRRRRRRRFDQQLAGLLQGIAAGLRAGLSLPQALEHALPTALSPTKDELTLVLKEFKLGVPLEEALENLGRRVGSEDLDLTVVAANVARQIGGNMAVAFEEIAATVRERFRLAGKLEAATAQGRLQGSVLALMPLVLGVAVTLMRPELTRPLVGHAFGTALAASVLGLELLGVALVVRIVRADV